MHPGVSVCPDDSDSSVCGAAVVNDRRTFAIRESDVSRAVHIESRLRRPLWSGRCVIRKPFSGALFTRGRRQPEFSGIGEKSSLPCLLASSWFTAHLMIGFKEQ